MEVFIHEDYVNKRNEVRREQRRVVAVQRQIPNCERAAVAGGRSGGGGCWLAVGASPPLRLPQAVLVGCRRDARVVRRGMSSVQPNKRGVSVVKVVLLFLFVSAVIGRVCTR
jgi:hypothetical protein